MICVFVLQTKMTWTRSCQKMMPQSLKRRRKPKKVAARAKAARGIAPGER